MRVVSVLAVAAGLIGTAAWGQTTAQQDYEAATALDAKGDYASSLVAWQHFAARPGLSARTRAIAKVREGAALVELRRLDDGAAASRIGLAALPKNDPTLAGDRWKANLVLGQAADVALDYAGAASYYSAAEATAPDAAAKVIALIKYIRDVTFVDPNAARAALIRLDQAVPQAGLSRADLAQVARVHTLVELNTGDLRAAKASAMDAVEKMGGITERTSVEDARARSDAAIVYLLSRQPDEARRYMAMSGAGRLGKSTFEPGVQMRAPDCGGEAGLKPGDVAVIEFAIGDDGRTYGARPIYAAGGPAAGLAFAQAVRDWSWSPEQVKDIPGFFRVAARVEMRCSTAFERPSIGDGLDSALESWLADKGVKVADMPDGSATAAVTGQRAAVASMTARSANSLEMLGALYRLADNPVVGDDERQDLLRRALAIARAHAALPLALLALDLPLRRSGSLDAWKPDVYGRLVAPMLAEQPYASDPQARSALRLLLADRYDAGSRGRMAASVTTLLRQVADDKALAPNDPYRVGALVRIASIEERNGDPTAARAAFERTGLSADQCALMDAPPKMTSLPGSNAFPMEAMQWGFEGWTLVQYDIGADGRSQNARALLSYPPFIFTKAGTDVFGKATFAKTYRPDGALGCGAIASRVKFLMPGN